MNFICEVCGDSVDSLGFHIEPPDNDEPVQVKNCVACRLEAMRKKAILPRSQPRRWPLEKCNIHSARLPYLD